MRTLLKSLTPFVLLLATSAARAELTAQMLLEDKLESKISHIVHLYDPIATIQLKVEFKKISTPLPGTAMDLKNFAAVSGDLSNISGDDLESINVTVTSAKFPLPGWLKSQIEAETNIPGPKKNLNFAQMSDAMKKDLTVATVNQEKEKSAPTIEDMFKKYSILSENIFKRYNSFQEEREVRSQAQSQGLVKSVLLGMGALAGSALFLTTFISFFLMQRRNKELASIIEGRILPAIQAMGGLGGSNGGGATSRAPTTIKIDSDSASALGGGNGGGDGSGHSDLDGLPNQVLEAVFADCYWCHRDSYAAWMWSVASPGQRLALFQSKHLDAEYLKTIQSFKRERGDDHLDPSYMAPLPVHHVSQEDLAKWVHANPSAWHCLTPMRQLTLPIPLKERLSCITAETMDRSKLPAPPSAESVKRKLVAATRIGELSKEDELTIFRNPALVPENLRVSMRSLVWLALKPFETRQKVLESWSAEDLASAWVSTPEALARLSEALPEKKKQMLDSYLAGATPSRNSEVYKALVDEGLKADVAASSAPKGNVRVAA